MTGRRRRPRGFTLVELVVSLGLIVVVLGAVGTGIVLLLRGHEQSERTYDLAARERIIEARFEALCYSVELSPAPIAGGGSVSVDGGTLVFTYADGSRAAVDGCSGAAISFYVDEGTGACRLTYTVATAGAAVSGGVTLLNMRPEGLPSQGFELSNQPLYYAG